jgi:hypothetical protein
MTNFNQILAASKNTVSIDLSDWTKASVNKKTEEDPVFTYDFDPLALTLGLLDQDNHYTDIHTLLSSSNEVISNFQPLKYNNIFTLINDFQSKSETIQRYFKHRLLLRRLKNQYISKYMNALEDLLNNPCCLKLSNIKILLKLPEFYREGIETDNLFKNYQSIEPPFRQDNVKDHFQFVGKISRHSSQENKLRYYFSNSNNNLLLIESVLGSNEQNLMDYMLRHSKSIIIEGCAYIKHQPGYEDFLIYQQGRFKYYDPYSKTAS